MSDCISSAVHEANVNAGKTFIDIFPNPMNGEATVDFVSTGAALSIDLLDVQGRVVQKIANGRYPKGQQQLQISTRQLPAGTYFCRLRSRNINQAKQVVKF